MSVDAKTPWRACRFGNFHGKIYEADGLSREWWGTDTAEPSELTVLRQSRLRNGARVFDCGAHQGIIALEISEAVGPDGEVIALEALPGNAEIAERNRLLSKQGNLAIINAAVSDSVGTTKFINDLNGMIGDGNHPVWKGEWIDVKTVSVDYLAERYGHPDVVFIDVEGAEGKVLAGATNTLAGPPTDWFVEAHVNSGLEIFGGNAAQILAYFDPERYHIMIRMDQGQFRDLRPEDRELTVHFFIIAMDRRAL